MENSKQRETSQYIVAGGIAAVVIFMLLALGLLARTQMPVDPNVVAASGVGEAQTEAEAEPPAEVEAAAESTVASSAEATSVEADAADAEETSASENVVEAEAKVQAESEAESLSEVISLADVTLSADERLDAFAAGGCSSCHVIPNVTGAVGQLGPDLTHIGTIAATRVQGMSAVDYVLQSLVEPNAYIVEECPSGPCVANLMQAINIAALSDREVDGIINYMLSLTDSTADSMDGSTETTVEADAEPAVEETITDETNTEEPATEEPVAEQPVAEQPVVEEAPLDMEVVSTVVTKGTCGACHVIPGIDSAVGVLGPNLTGIGATATTRIEGYTAEEYLYESIVDPNAFIAPECPAGDCPANVMLPNLVDLLTEEEIGTIVSYLSSLQ